MCNKSSKILKKSGIPYNCSDCGIDGRYNGKSLTLQVDHINGERHDHSLENLRWLCPNCHSQTNTYCARNTKHLKKLQSLYEMSDNELKNLVDSLSSVELAEKFNVPYKTIHFYLKRRGIKKKRKASYYTQSNYMPEKENLQELIAKYPNTEIAKEYNVSETAVRKWIKKYNIKRIKKCASQPKGNLISKMSPSGNDPAFPN